MFEIEYRTLSVYCTYVCGGKKCTCEMGGGDSVLMSDVKLATTVCAEVRTAERVMPRVGF